MLPAAVSQGNSAGSWNMNATPRPPSLPPSSPLPASTIDTSPAVGLSRPATSDSSVDLPQPDAPIGQANSPGATSRDTWSSARTAEPPRPNTLDTPVSRTDAAAAGAAPPSATVTELTYRTIPRG